MDTNKALLRVEELDVRIVPNALPLRGPYRIIGDAPQQHIQRPQNNDRDDRDDRNDRVDRNRAEGQDRNPGRNGKAAGQDHIPPGQQRAIAGAKGAYTTTGEPGALGATRSLRGNIRLSGLGTLRLTGSLHDVGDVIQGRPGGQLVLTNRLGSITLQLTAAARSVTDELPTLYKFRVVDGTGKFVNTTGHGKVRLVMTPADDVSGTFTMKFARRAVA